MKPEYELAKTLIRDRADWTGELPADDPWGFLMALSFDLAEHLYFNESVLVDDYSPGIGYPDDASLEELRAKFAGYPVDLMLEAANGPLSKQRERLREQGLDY